MAAAAIPFGSRTRREVESRGASQVWNEVLALARQPGVLDLVRRCVARCVAAVRCALMRPTRLRATRHRGRRGSRRSGHARAKSASVTDGCAARPRQGWPDFGASAVARSAAAAALSSDADGARLNQYTVANGLPALNEALADYYNTLHGWRLDPATEARASAHGPSSSPVTVFCTSNSIALYRCW